MGSAVHVCTHGNWWQPTPPDWGVTTSLYIFGKCFSILFVWFLCKQFFMYMWSDWSRKVLDFVRVTCCGEYKRLHFWWKDRIRHLVHNERWQQGSVSNRLEMKVALKGTGRSVENITSNQLETYNNVGSSYRFRLHLLSSSFLNSSWAYTLHALYASAMSRGQLEPSTGGNP